MALRKNVLDPFWRNLLGRLAIASDDYSSIGAAIRATQLQLDNAPAIVKPHLMRIIASHKVRFAQAMRRSLGINIVPVLADLETAGILQAYTDANVQLIKSIPNALKSQLTQDLLHLSRTNPFDQQALTRLLAERYGKTGYPLRRLARDQNNKLVGQLSQVRQQAANIDEYEWSTSDDERVRPTHVENDGMLFLWNQPPAATGHPGHDIQCRCVALPVVRS